VNFIALAATALGFLRLRRRHHQQKSQSNIRRIPSLVVGLLVNGLFATAAIRITLGGTAVVVVHWHRRTTFAVRGGRRGERTGRTRRLVRLVGHLRLDCALPAASDAATVPRIHPSASTRN